MKHLKLAFLLTLFISMVGITASAHDIAVKNSDGVTIYYVWNNDQTELAVSYRGSDYYSYSSEYSGNVVIPESVTYNGKGYPVRSIGSSAFFDCTGLTSVTIPNSVASIGDYTFYGCAGLTSVTIPNSVTSISSSAFYGCTGLSSVTIGSGVASIGSYAFSGCTGLTSVTINSNAITSKTYTSNSNLNNVFGSQVEEYILGGEVTSIGDYTFYNCTSLSSVTIGSGVTSIGSSAFSGCTGLTSVTIPNSVTSIKDETFYGCTGLTSVTINSNAIASKTYTSNSNLNNVFGSQVKEYILGEGVKKIGDYAFYGCSSMTSVTIPNSVTSIGSSAFLGCKGLTSVTIGSGVTSIGYSAFYGCAGLTSVTIPNSVTSIGSYAFSGCTGLTSVTIPESVTSIGSFAFSICTGLTSVTIGSGVTSIGDYTFYNCTGLTSVTIPKSVTSIGSSAFYDCTGLTSVTINSNAIASKTYTSNSNLNNVFGSQVKEYILGGEVTSIGDYTFYNCTSLSSVTIGSGVTIIGDYAFRNCTDLTSVTIPESVTSIGSSAFAYCTGLTSVTIPESVTSIGGNAFYDCTGLTSVHISNLASWCRISFDNSSSNPLYYAHHLYFNNEEIKDLVIPEGITSIGNYAFYGCKCLTSITIPNSVTSIGSSAFSYCTGLTSVTIGSGVTSIGKYAFQNCTGLTSVHISNLASWCGISFNDYYSNPFYYAHHLFINDEEIKDLVIPEGVTSIGNYAFRNCTGLTSVTIPNSVMNIDKEAFSNCSGLTSVHISNLASWCVISFNDNYSNPLYFAQHLFINDEEIKDLVIPEGVTNIGNYAFRNYTGLTSVTIPNNVTSIGDYTFYNCTGLSSVTIPNSVTSIGREAFSFCTCLTSVTINSNAITSKTYTSNSNLNNVFGSQVKEYILGEGVKEIGDYAFCGCSSMTSVTIPSNVTSIGNNSFKDCTSIENIKFYVSDLASFCNNQCVGIINNSIGKPIQLIGIDGNEMKECIIPEGVNNIGEHCFSNCSGLTSLTIPSTLTSIGNESFYGCSGLTSLTLHTSVASIGTSAYGGCSGITDVKVIVKDIAELCNNNVVGLLQSSFDTPLPIQLLDQEGNEIQEIFVPESVTAIGTKGFMNCTGVNTVVMGNGVTSVGSNAFDGCKNLQSITIGRKVESIGNSAFSNCKKVERVISLLDRLFTINASVFAEEAYINAQLLVPLGQQSKYKSVSAWSKFLTVEERDFLSTHKLTYLVDGTVYKQYELDYDEVITPENEPEKEGHTFSGWSEIPNRMPPNDVNVTGMFSVNQYQVTFVVDGKVVATMMVDYGKTITPPDVPDMEGYNFAWTNLPETMPAEDIIVYGAYTSGIDNISNTTQDSFFYDLNGRRVNKLQRGVNIIRMSDGTTRKVVIK